MPIRARPAGAGCDARAPGQWIGPRRIGVIRVGCRAVEHAMKIATALVALTLSLAACDRGPAVTPYGGAGDDRFPGGTQIAPRDRNPDCATAGDPSVNPCAPAVQAAQS